MSFRTMRTLIPKLFVVYDTSQQRALLTVSVNLLTSITCMLVEDANVFTTNDSFEDVSPLPLF